MKPRLACLLSMALLVAAWLVRAQETVTVPQAATPNYRLSVLTLSADVPCRVNILLKSPTDQELSHFYVNDEACALIKELTTADLTKLSAQRRVFNKLIADKIIAGTVTGKPEK